MVKLLITGILFFFIGCEITYSQSVIIVLNPLARDIRGFSIPKTLGRITVMKGILGSETLPAIKWEHKEKLRKWKKAPQGNINSLSYKLLKTSLLISEIERRREILAAVGFRPAFKGSEHNYQMYKNRALSYVKKATKRSGLTFGQLIDGEDIIRLDSKIDENNFHHIFSELQEIATQHLKLMALLGLYDLISD